MSEGSETSKEYTQDIIFGLGFFIIAILAAWRTYIYFDFDGGGKVITAFYSLIFSTAILRSIWFFIPKTIMMGSYIPTAHVAFVTSGWMGVFISEVVLALGSLSLYAVFILIVCYWAHMLRKVEHVDAADSTLLATSQRVLARYPKLPKSRRGPMQNFALLMLLLLLLETLNILFFLFQIYNSEAMILFDSLFMSAVSIGCLVQITIFSNRIRNLLQIIGVINANSTRAQVRRILAITIAANIFFIWRFLTEIVLSLVFLYYWRVDGSFNVPMSHEYWSVYLDAKHWSEMAVLLLELLISTAIPAPAASTMPSRSRRTGEYHRITEMRPVTAKPSEGTPLAPHVATTTASHYSSA